MQEFFFRKINKSLKHCETFINFCSILLEHFIVFMSNLEKLEL